MYARIRRSLTMQMDGSGATRKGEIERERERGVRRGRSCGKQNAEKLLNFARSTLNIPFYRKLGNTTSEQLAGFDIFVVISRRGRGGCGEIKITCSSIRSLKRF